MQNNTELVPSGPTVLARSRAASLTRRGLTDLRTTESAETWVKRGDELFSEGRREGAFACYQGGIAVNPMHPGLQYKLGSSYYLGFGVLEDYEQAAAWIRKAANQGEPNAQGVLGTMYAYGHGVPLDQIRAGEWIRKATDQGELNAQYNLGLFYSSGHGVAADHVEAVA